MMLKTKNVKAIAFEKDPDKRKDRSFSSAALSQTDIFRPAAPSFTNLVVFPSQSVRLCSAAATQPGVFHTVKGFCWKNTHTESIPYVVDTGADSRL